MIKSHKSLFLTGLMTFLSFIFVGFIPLLAYVVNYFSGGETGSLFLTSCLLTSLAFLIIGYLKSYVNQSSKIKSVLETLILGGMAAAVAYLVGDVLEKIITL
ncbi:MAG: VIT1/CCC1 transporter family protein [Bacteroidetes bacterium]|nr:VIT1/CCC1 transporter family protein [Bacteroidota bacterium]